MATFASDSDSSDYGDFTAEEEELLSALVDRVSRESLPAPTPAPAPAPARASAPSLPPFSSTQAPDPLFVDEAIQGITEDDLSFDITELESNFALPPSRSAKPYPPNHFAKSPPLTHPPALVSPPDTPKHARPNQRKLSPSVSRNHDVGVPSFVSKVKARHTPTANAVLPTDVCYPDISGALSNILNTTDTTPKPEDQVSAKPDSEDKRSPLLRFRTFPKKPFSVSDLTAGSWCELQYYYTLTKRGGKRTRTAAMKNGSDVHEKLEREVYTPVEIEITKKEDAFGLKIWNIIQGLRTLRDTGLTRELEVWGVIDDDNLVVNGIIDGLSYENPDPELEEDVISSRGGSQTPPGSQPKLVSEFFPSTTPSERVIYITDVKTRASLNPPSKAQVRGTIIQLFLYHRFLCDMASDKLDYLRTFERYGLNPDEKFSDSFLAQIASLHDEILSDDSDASWCSETSDSAATTDFDSAVSSPSKLKGPVDGSPDTLKYSTLRALIPLLKFEIQLTFPKGASSVGKIVAVEYRYRGRARPEAADDGKNERRKPGSVICTNTHFVEPDILDMYLKDDMKWWRGEREPRGVSLEEAFKCRSCEFVDTCEWRHNLDQEALRKAKSKGKGEGPTSW